MSRTGAVGVGATLLAIACCAGLPLAVSILGGLALTAWLGVVGGIVALAAIAIAVVIHVRRRAGAQPAGHDPSEGDRR
jgi:hypothetical protein